jgi:hypothetical protein
LDTVIKKTTHKNLVNVVIPIYKQKLTINERSSLNQCVKVLSGYSITLVCPKGLDLMEYYLVYPDFKIEYFDIYYFKSLQGYNKLLLSTNFYKRFKAFKYILIYQLDAWVFRDELEYWCQQNYDYIGAPWFEGWDKVSFDTEFIGVGNGGFSLRKVKTFTRFISNPSLWINKSSLRLNVYKGGYKDLLLIIPRLLRRLYNNNLQIARRRFSGNEDYFWSKVIGANSKDFKMPNEIEAAKFSFEMNPERLYEITGKTLPFGCHAWNKNLQFWGRYILRLEKDYFSDDQSV